MSRPLRILRVRLARAMTRLELATPESFHRSPMALASLLAHAFVLLILALILTGSGGLGRAGETLARWAADGSDGPIDLTKLDDDTATDEAIRDEALTLATTELNLDARDVLADASPRIAPPTSALADQARADLARVDAPAPNGQSRGPNPAEGEIVGGPSTFTGRRGEGRKQLVVSQGGNADSERAVEYGLDWLARHQELDGRWRMDYHNRCTPGARCPADDAMPTDAAATGLALLTFLAAGHAHNDPSPYQKNVERGLRWLIAHQKPNGDLHQGEPGNAWMYSHAIAALALCEAYGLSNDDLLKAPAQRSINFIVAAQEPTQGGWRYAPRMMGDTSVFGWQALTLRSGRLAGLKVPAKTIKGLTSYLNLAAASPDGATYSYRPRRSPNIVMTAEALLVRQYLGWPRDHRALQRGVELVYRDLMSQDDPERNIYYWYYATQLLHNVDDQRWGVWNRRIRDYLIDTQVTDAGCERGSWDPLFPKPDEWQDAGGRMYVTTLSLLTLEVYYRYLPLYVKPENELARAADQRDPRLSADRAKPSGPIANAGGGKGAGANAKPKAP